MMTEKVSSVDFLVKNKKPASKIYSPIDILTKENARYNERKEREFQHEDGQPLD